MKPIALVAVLLMWGSFSAHAMVVQLKASSSFVDRSSDDPRDIFTLTNTSDSGVHIDLVTIDLGTANLFIDIDTEGGFPFTVDTGALETGFSSVSGDFTGSTSLRLTFTDFEPGETFAFFIDVDDGSSSGIVEGDEFAGTGLQMTFGGGLIPDTSLSALYQKTGPFEARAQLQGASATIACDGDGDGDVDAQDALAVLAFLLRGTPLAGNGDCDEDGAVTFRDVFAILRTTDQLGS